ncbi:MAG: putative membrane protein YqiK, partial [Bradymonadia bacterium]
MDALVIAGMVLFVIVVIALGAVVMVGRLYQKVDQGKALIINKLKADPDVTFTGGIVLPVIHRVETMDISVKTIEVDRRGDDGLICKDNIRADIKVTFFVRVNKTSDDVLKVAQSIGCQRASDQNTLEQLFAAKFSEALKTVGKWLEFEELYTKRDAFRDQIIKIIGKDLNGYVLEDAAIDYLEQTPLSRLDPSNILDAQGIRKITMITAAQNVQTNELKQKERMEIGQQDLTADEAIFRYDQQRAEAEARKQREIDVAETREQNEAKRYQVEEDKQTDLAKQVAQEEIQRKEQEVLRNVEVAQKQRERVVTIEAVEVQKAHDLKQVEREREVELQRIEKEKQIEREKKEIADVIRGRIAVDKTVAEEEERIKDLRATAEATRVKDVAVITAEGEAQAELVKSLKAAEAEQEVAKFRASERITLAQAELEASEKLAAGKIRLAEGIQAES